MSTKSKKGTVNPANLAVGRRTGLNVLEGKNIRKLDNGMDNFDDYWSESSEEESLGSFASVTPSPQVPMAKLNYSLRSMTPFSAESQGSSALVDISNVEPAITVQPPADKSIDHVVNKTNQSGNKTHLLSRPTSRVGGVSLNQAGDDTGTISRNDTAKSCLDGGTPTQTFRTKKRLTYSNGSDGRCSLPSSGADKIAPSDSFVKPSGLAPKRSTRASTVNRKVKNKSDDQQKQTRSSARSTQSQSPKEITPPVSPSRESSSNRKSLVNTDPIAAVSDTTIEPPTPSESSISEASDTPVDAKLAQRVSEIPEEVEDKEEVDAEGEEEVEEAEIDDSEPEQATQESTSQNEEQVSQVEPHPENSTEGLPQKETVNEDAVASTSTAEVTGDSLLGFVSVNPGVRERSIGVIIPLPVGSLEYEVNDSDGSDDFDIITGQDALPGRKSQYGKSLHLETSLQKRKSIADNKSKQKTTEQTQPPKKGQSLKKKDQSMNEKKQVQSRRETASSKSYFNFSDTESEFEDVPLTRKVRKIKSDDEVKRRKRKSQTPVSKTKKTKSDEEGKKKASPVSKTMQTKANKEGMKKPSPVLRQVKTGGPKNQKAENLRRVKTAGTKKQKSEQEPVQTVLGDLKSKTTNDVLKCRAKKSEDTSPAAKAQDNKDLSEKATSHVVSQEKGGKNGQKQASRKSRGRPPTAATPSHQDDDNEGSEDDEMHIKHPHPPTELSDVNEVEEEEVEPTKKLFKRPNQKRSTKKQPTSPPTQQPGRLDNEPVSPTEQSKKVKKPKLSVGAKGAKNARNKRKTFKEEEPAESPELVAQEGNDDMAQEINYYIEEGGYEGDDDECELDGKDQNVQQSSPNSLKSSGGNMKSLPMTTSKRSNLKTRGSEQERRKSSRKRCAPVHWYNLESPQFKEPDDSPASGPASEHKSNSDVGDELSPPVMKKSRPRKVQQIIETPQTADSSKCLRRISQDGIGLKPAKPRKSILRLQGTPRRSVAATHFAEDLPQYSARKSEGLQGLPRYSTSSPLHFNDVTQSQTPKVLPRPKKNDSKIYRPNTPVEGLRRSRRTKVKPLDWFRNERISYKLNESGFMEVAGIESPDDEEQQPVMKRVNKLKNLVKKKQMKTKAPKTPRRLSMHREFDGHVSATETTQIAVVNPDTEEEVYIDCMRSRDTLTFRGPHGGLPYDDDPFLMSKALVQRAFSSGKLVLRPLAHKARQLVQKDSMIFYIVHGRLGVEIHQTSIILESGDFFFVPQGNIYSIKNLRNEEAKLVFYQHKQ